MERFMEIVFPIKHRLTVTRTKVLISISVVWLIGIGEKFALLMSPARWSETVGCFFQYPNDTAKKMAGLMNFFTEYVIPLVLIGTCYILMAWSLHNKVKVQHLAIATHGVRGPGGGGGPTKAVFGLSRAKKNILVTMIIIVAFFIALNTYKQYLLIFSCFGRSKIGTLEFSVSQIFAFMNSTIDPYIYLVSHKEFRVGFRRLFHPRNQVMPYESEVTGYKNAISNSAADKQAPVNQARSSLADVPSPSHNTPCDVTD